jgi:SWI/SNF-related matrix-associated actin-dependent regulator 1 of chromatin subfamily A
MSPSKVSSLAALPPVEEALSSPAAPAAPTVRLRHDGQRFIAECAYEHRHIPKEAGFRWDPERRCWWTVSPERAALLANEADEAARQALGTDPLGHLQAPPGCTYFPYQLEAVRFAIAHEGTLLADEMGLGKTVMAIGVMDATKSRRTLVVCPLSVRPVWEAEIARWSMFPRTVGVATATCWPEEARTVIIHPEVLVRHETALLSQLWDLVIADEAHLFKNYGAERTQVLFGSPRKGHPGVRSLRRLALTGTPLPNRPKELYSILNWLQPGQWGTKHAFEERYCDGHWEEGWDYYDYWDANGASNLDELADRLRAKVMVRRLKADVLDQLPEKRRRVVAFRAEEVGRSAVLALEAERKVLAKVGIDTTKKGWEAQVLKLTPRGAAFEEISRVRKRTALAKVPVVASYVATALESGSVKVVLWAHHHEVIDRLAKRLAPYGVVIMDGRTAVAKRAAIVERFQADPKARVFLGGITVAGLGITLTASSHVVFAELDWVPGNLSQAEDRCHRIGQASSVLVEHVVLDKSLDALMARVVLGKQKVQRAVLSDRPHKKRAAVKTDNRKGGQDDKPGFSLAASSTR